MVKKEFNYSADNFRAISIFFVLASHLSNLSTNHQSWNFILSDATTWFIFISGYLFFQIESSKEFSYSKYLIKKIKFVIIPYIIISIPCIIAGIYFNHHGLLGLDRLNYTLWSLLTGGTINGPIWFIPMIAIFFLFSPFFFLLSRQRTFTIALMALSTTALSIYSSRPSIDSNPFFSFIHFFGFYVLGMFFYKLRPNVKFLSTSLANCIIIVGIILFAIVLFLDQKNSENALLYRPFFQNIGSINLQVLGKLCLLLSIVVFLEKYLNMENKYLRYISSISFGIFFLHGIFILIFNRFINLNIDKEIYGLLIELIFVAFSSVIAIEIIKKFLKSRSRYVIGC